MNRIFHIKSREEWELEHGRCGLRRRSAALRAEPSFTVSGLRPAAAIAVLFLGGCNIETAKPDPQGFFHALIYGNPNKREWECVGKCPAEVRRIEAIEDAEKSA